MTTYNIYLYAEDKAAHTRKLIFNMGFIDGQTEDEIRSFAKSLITTGDRAVWVTRNGLPWFQVDRLRDGTLQAKHKMIKEAAYAH
jgi:hypothetical protein